MKIRIIKSIIILSLIIFIIYQWFYSCLPCIVYIKLAELLDKLSFLSNNLMELYKNSNIEFFKEFLLAAVVFEGVAISVALPTSMEIINQTTGRYKKKVFKDRVYDEISYKIIRFYILHIVLCLTNIAFYPYFQKISFYSYFYLFLFIWFLVNAIGFKLFMDLVGRYVGNPDLIILDRGDISASRYLGKNKK